MEFTHRPVMQAEAVRFLGCRPGGIYVDATAGGGGHALGILRAAGTGARLIGIDRDADALEATSKTLKDYEDSVTLVQEDFRNIDSVLRPLGIEKADGILFDLGVSSYQLDEGQRGFSFRLDARLDMRMDTRQAKTAYDLVNTLSREELAKIFRVYGEERNSARIASAIERARSIKPIETTGELKEIVLNAVPKKFHGGRTHPATRVFQALRIAVNDELEGLSEALGKSVFVLRSKGRLVVITYHSLEDRIVKEAFRGYSHPCVCPPRLPMCACGKRPVLKVLTKKPVMPSDEEVMENPRARSAKLRAAERL
ncbi:MAG: 16S rRNA (cytosine(1402)-N(4))-methyltransferase RsmH [Deltaproteobacteria bacterium]|nr:16S rRNA (cytosine(1402)-N(4))-methyltransferase RsmH [Deltaproteobacteria bacterium]